MLEEIKQDEYLQSWLNVIEIGKNGGTAYVGIEIAGYDGLMDLLKETFDDRIKVTKLVPSKKIVAFRKSDFQFELERG